MCSSSRRNSPPGGPAIRSRRQPANNRSRCWSRNRTSPRRTRMVSNKPSPYWRPRSRESIRVLLRPLIHVLNLGYQRAQQAFRLGPRLGQLLPGARIRDNAGAGAKLEDSALSGDGANEDIEIAAAVAVQIAD